MNMISEQRGEVGSVLAVGARSGASGPTDAAAWAARSRLDQERDNRKRTVKGEYVGSGWDGVQVGSYVGRVTRGGGSFDPLGVRKVDVERAGDVVGLVRALAGRWLLLTFTIDRKLFVGPEAAYQRANEYVRKAVAEACPKGIWLAALELQGKTGAGWPHWHVLAWCPDSRPVDEVKRAALKAWRTRTAEVDPATGEVLSWSSESIGFVDVEEVESVNGAAVYVGKYITKQWPAVAPWMLHSTCRFRKVRWSSRSYAVLEKLGRHEVHRGGRKPRVEREHRPRVRTLLDRMASSGASLLVFQIGHYGKLSFVASVPMCAEQVQERLKVVRDGPLRRRWFDVPRAVLDRRDSFRLKAGEFREARARRIGRMWDELQDRREWEELQRGRYAV